MRDQLIPLALLSVAMLSLPQHCSAQTNTESVQQQRSSVRDAYQGGWQVAAETRSREVAADDANFTYLLDSVGHLSLSLDRFREERNAALARNQGQLNEADRTQLRQQAVVLNSMQPNSFEGRLANYFAEFPSQAAWSELDMAARLQPARLELVAPVLTKAVRDGDRANLVPAAKDMKARGDVAPALYMLADDILLSVERGAVLVAAGEMDGFPLLVRQYAEGKRNDVLVIDHRLLDDPAYRATAWKQADASGAVPASATAFLDALDTRTKRPVFFSLALGRSVAARYAGRLHVSGLAMRVSDSACCPIAALDEAWKKMRKTAEAGPLSRNYLVPAVVLLKHYRESGDERRASELEHQVRQMAQRMGATRELQATGILPH